MKDIYIENTKLDLLNNINILSFQIDNLKNIDILAKKVKKVVNLRVTIIAKDGRVLGDSDKNFNLMDNHSNRAEIREAKYQKYGSSIRYSNTLQKNLLYVSKRFTINKTIYYIRMARDIAIINQKFLYLSIKIAIFFLLFMLFVFWVSLRISKNVEDETKYILEFLRDLTHGNKAIKIESNYSIEFHKITKLLTLTSKKLAQKNQKKSKYTAKLKLLNRQKDDIISAISHEFKNPIAVISGYTQIILEDKDINPIIRENFLKKILSNSNKLTNMIDRLRLSIRLDNDKGVSIFELSNINSLIVGVIEDIKSTYKNRDIIFISNNDINIEIDKAMFSVVIINLIENAIKYSQDKVIIELDTYSLKIKDTGIGIKSSDIEKITDKFYRVSTNSWNNSLGVGLSLVKNIINIHKFKLKITSIENEGSIFEIVFK
ncbi:Two-component system histidine kinase [hydrothermal vent metagenome]|uniref:histidine kinase n=1 Tax=hydrothermal vent metagenome TaxID=652676 RepID=A0A1W1EHE0_9ZZZZ